MNNRRLEELSDRCIPPDQAAKLLHLKPQTVKNWMSLGRLKKVKIGRKTFCDRKDVEEVLRRALK